MSIWNSSPQHELATNPLSGKLGADHSDETGRLQGGLFGLDAVHPTTAGYGIIAQAVLDVLNAAGIASPRIDFTQLLAQDTLNSRPPALFTRIFTLLAPFLTRLAGPAA